MENIYEDFGTIISDPIRYISRSLIEKSINDRICGNNFGSFSLVGLPRIGKSSILNQLFSQSDEIVINIVLSSISANNIKNFFDKFVRETVKKLKKLNLFNNEIEYSYNEFTKCDFDTLGTEYFLEFIENVVYETNKKIIVIIDEFDAATKLFKSAPHYFQVIREMAIQSIYNTAFVFSSRRLVEEIEMRMDGVSNLRQVLKIGYIKPYCDNEQVLYFEKLSQYFTITDEVKLFYKSATGFYPLLMDILSVHLVNEYKKRDVNYIELNVVYTKYINEFYEQYEKLKTLLIEENLFDALLQISFQMPFDIKPERIQRLRNYGLIDENYIVFSESFQHYLLEQKGLSDYHQIWNKTEKGLKSLSKDIYQKVYGNDWDTKIKLKYQDNILIKNAIKYQKIEAQNFNQPANALFIDTISTTGLLFLIQSEWHHFNNVFSKSKEYWNEVFEPIKNTRNVIQHNREEVLDELEFKKVLLNCEGIVEIIDNYFKIN